MTTTTIETTITELDGPTTEQVVYRTVDATIDWPASQVSRVDWFDLIYIAVIVLLIAAIGGGIALAISVL